MTRYIDRHLGIWGLTLCASALCTACTEDDFTSPSAEDNSGVAVNLTSTKQFLITRAGDDITDFQENSEYRLFAVQSAETYLWSTQSKTDGGKVMYSMPGRETADHDIEYNFDSKNVNFNYQRADKLDFYAIVVDREDDTKDANGKSIYSLRSYVDGLVEQGYERLDSTKRADGVDPTIPWSVGTCSSRSNQPGDLMYASAREKTFEDGQVTLNFKHALTRFTFEVAKQNESEDDDKWLEGIKLESIEVHGTHSKGTFNICTGKWTYEADDVEKAPYVSVCDYDLINHQEITTEAKSVKESLLVFPNNGEKLTLKVAIHFPKKPADFNKNVAFKDSAGGWRVEVSTPLTVTDTEYAKDDNASPITFSSNYSYKFSIVVMRNDVRIMAVTPTVYEWITNDGDKETAVVGQPVTFGNLLWMDRNLGASTWDAENDFYGSIGYYYQYGRNIPYIMDIPQFTHYIDDDDEHSLTASSKQGFAVIMPTAPNGTIKTSGKSVDIVIGAYAPWVAHGKKLESIPSETLETLRREQVNCFYTYYQSEKVVDGRIVRKMDDTVCGYSKFYRSDRDEYTPEKPIRYVGDVITNKDGTINYELTKRCLRFSVLDTVKITPTSTNVQTYCQWTAEDIYAYNYWINVEDQPCPKGWRLPTKADLYEFMPWSKVSWSGKFPQKLEVTGSATSNNHSGWTQYGIYGKITPRGKSYYSVLYMLNKKNDETEAYRICIKSQFAKGYTDEYKKENRDSQNKRYITISRYSADPTKSLVDYMEYDEDNNPKDWEGAIESVQYPCAGFIVTEQQFFDLRTFGDGTVVRTSESSDKISPETKSTAMYLAQTNYELNIETGTRRSLGDQVRCCRDISAQ